MTFHFRNLEVEPSIELLGSDQTPDPNPRLSISAWQRTRNSSVSLKTFGVVKDYKNNSKCNQPITKIWMIFILWGPKRPHNLLGRLNKVDESTTRICRWHYYKKTVKDKHLIMIPYTISVWAPRSYCDCTIKVLVLVYHWLWPNVEYSMTPLCDNLNIKQNKSTDYLSDRNTPPADMTWNLLDKIFCCVVISQEWRNHVVQNILVLCEAWHPYHILYVHSSL